MVWFVAYVVVQADLESLKERSIETKTNKGSFLRLNMTTRREYETDSDSEADSESEGTVSTDSRTSFDKQNDAERLPYASLGEAKESSPVSMTKEETARQAASPV